MSKVQLSEQERDELLRLQTERWQDPETHVAAQERADRAQEAVRRSEWRRTLQEKQMQRVHGFKNKVYWMRQMVQTWAEAVEPESACKAGCSACCYQPVMISEQEAEVIGREIGVQPRKPEQWRTEPAREFTGSACPFLQDGRCSIYSVRPMACRLLFNMDRDDLLCRIVPGASTQVPYANAMALNLSFVQAHFPKGISKVSTPEQLLQAIEQTHLGDLRDFFPDGLQGQLAGCC